MACWGFCIGRIVLFVIADLDLRLTPREPPIGWFRPMMWTGFGFGVVGAWVGGLFVARYDLVAAIVRREEARQGEKV